MTRKVAIIGDLAQCEDVSRIAKGIGMEAVLLSSEPGVGSDAVEAIVSQAQAQKADGLFCASERMLVSVADAAARLGLPGHEIEAARRMRDKLAMRRGLDGVSGLNPRYHAVREHAEAEFFAREMGAPLVVKPVDGWGSMGVTRVDYLEDLPLAVTQAFRHSAQGVVLLEEHVSGREFRVEGYASDGGFRPVAIVESECAAPPCLFDRAVSVPPDLDEDARQSILRAAGEAVDSLGKAHGVVHVEIVLSAAGLYVVEVSDVSGAGRVVSDLLPAATGSDPRADALRMAVGDCPCENATSRKAAALRWLTCRSGFVSEVIGVEVARALAGVVRLEVAAKPGDCLGHATDVPSREAVGYVVAVSDWPEGARETARRAAEMCEIVTQPFTNHP